LLDVATDIAPILAAAMKAIRIFRMEFTSYQERVQRPGFPNYPFTGFPSRMIIRTIVAISGEIRSSG
jgi:hypothetical protein